MTDIEAEDYPAIISGLPEGSYHIYDYQFFYRNLQENVETRLTRFLEQANTESLEEVRAMDEEMTSVDEEEPAVDEEMKPAA